MGTDNGLHTGRVAGDDKQAAGGNPLIVVSYGGGTNSTAMLIGMKERGIRPDLILFADTGSEKPHTYEHLEIMQKWLADNDMPTITVVKNEKPSRYGGLYEYCEHHKCLPSVAYGFKTCSLMFKVEPQDLYLKEHGITNIEKWIGFDADEPNRAKDIDENVYPLIEWDWGRDECVEAIARAGLKQPGKSSCFFCPNSKVQEIKWLRDNCPDLAEKAIKMESWAELTSIKGLGRNFSWKNVMAQTEMCFTDMSNDLPCGCYDGD